MRRILNHRIRLYQFHLPRIKIYLARHLVNPFVVTLFQNFQSKHGISPRRIKLRRLGLEPMNEELMDERVWKPTCKRVGTSRAEFELPPAHHTAHATLNLSFALVFSRQHLRLLRCACFALLRPVNTREGAQRGRQLDVKAGRSSSRRRMSGFNGRRRCVSLCVWVLFLYSFTLRIFHPSIHPRSRCACLPSLF